MALLTRLRHNGEGKAALPRFQLKLLIGWLTTSLAVAAQAQLVADGATRILNGVVTNLPSLTIGTNASFTQLQIINNSRVTNTISYVGRNVISHSNMVIVNGVGSHWHHGDLTFGEHGSWNKFIITNGGSVSGSRCGVGSVGSASNQSIVVTGTNSFWSVTDRIGSGKGVNNYYVVTNGGRILCGGAGLWDSDTAVVTGGGSSWTNTSFSLNHHSVLVISNRGTMFTTGTGSLRTSDSTVTITDPGSLWRQSALYVGELGNTNKLTIANGGRIISGSAWISGYSRTNNQVIVTGPDSLWTNSSVMYVGIDGVANQLAIRNGGKVITRYCTVGLRACLKTPKMREKSWILGDGSRRNWGCVTLMT